MEPHLAAVFAVLLATLAVPTFGAPVKVRTSNVRTSNLSTSHHACGRNVKNDSSNDMLRSRHGPAKLLGPVKKQIGIANKYFKSQEKSISNLYSQVSEEIDRESYNYSWLPQNQTEWYNNSISSLKKTAKVKKGLQAFHNALEKFLFTFEELENFSPGSNVRLINVRLRNKTIRGITARLRQVFCEVHSVLQGVNVNITEQERPDLSKMNWDNNPDETRSLLRDWGVISLYKKFLADWMIIVDCLKKKTVCTVSPRINKKRKKTKSKTTPRT